MNKPRFKHFQDYFQHVKRLIALRSDESNSLRIVRSSKLSGTIRGKDIRLHDGRMLTILESVEIDKFTEQADRSKYVYDYTEPDGTVIFRYERDPENVHPIRHPEFHLHVSSDRGPRFTTVPVDLDWVVGFIGECFSKDSSTR